MRTLFHISAVIIAILIFSCSSQTNNKTNLRKIDTAKATILIDTPKSFVKNYGINDTTQLFAFVGEKISVEPIPSQRGSMDNSFKAKYSILKKVYGDFSSDTIEFIAYDHYGTPPFSKFKNVLLYVSADSGTYYHQKYMYNDVYKTNDGSWAGTYAIDDYQHPYNKHTKIKPVKIDFANRVAYPANDEYPKPFFKTVADSTIAIYGNYTDELFALKKTGVLTARGIFKATPEQEEYMVESFQPEPSKTPPGVDNLKFMAFWKTFVASINEPGLKSFRSIALDTLMICDKLRSADDFVNKCFNEVIDDEVRKRVIDKTKLEYTSSEVEFDNIFTLTAKKEILKNGNMYRFRQMLVTRNTKNNNPPEIVFNFIETKKGYRLYGIDHHWFKECCQ